MKNLKLKTSLAMLLMTTAVEAQEKTLVINELMQSNVECIMDDINEFPDSWVELYNASDAAVNLKDYAIGTKDKASKAWQLPDKTVEAKGYVIIYCDKEEQGLHTSFRLESGKGCTVYLFKGDEIVDNLPEALKKMPSPDIAYGRKTDGGDEWGYQITPTPGKANCGETTKNVLGEPVFSEKGRVMTSEGSISLYITAPEDAPEGTRVRYTTDGTEPTAESRILRGKLTISTNTTVRARLFCDGWLSPRSTVNSYIFLGRDMKIPVVSIVTNDDYLNGKEGIFTVNSKANQINWRRPINIEVFDAPEQESVINQICETRVMGGQSRDWARKSMAIYANKRFGTKRLDYEFFPDQKPGVTNFKSIMLRNAGNDFDYLFMRDAIIQRSMAQHADLDWQAWRPAVVFINGKYHSMLNFRERSNDDNIFTNYDELEDIDMIEISQENSKMVFELKAGSMDNYESFVKFYSEEGHTLAEYDQLMDWKEFANLMIMNLYFNNQDFPGNNMVLWRPTADGGKWRWISKDTDFGLGLYGSQPDFNSIKWIYDNNYDPNRTWANTPEATCLFRHLMDDQDFRREFIDRCLVYTGDFLNEAGVSEVWDPMFNLVKSELIIHRDALNPWGGWWGGSESSINNEYNNAKNWLKKRTDNFLKHVADYYKLGTLVKMTVNDGVEGAADAGITINGISLTSGTFNGKFVVGRKIHLEGNADSSKTITGWTVKADSKEETIDGSVLEMDVPNCKSLVIKAVLGEKTGINNITTNRKENAVYDLNGRKLRSGDTSLDGLPKGIYIIDGKKVIK